MNWSDDPYWFMSPRERAEAHHKAELQRARHGVVFSLRNLPWREAKGWHPWFGLIRRVDSRSIDRGRTAAKPPFGWRDVRESERDCVLRMPVWLYWIWNAWTYRWAPLRPLVRLGFWDVREGDYYSNGTFRLDWWRSAYPRWRIGLRETTRFDRFGLWIQRRVLDDFARRMPRWSAS